MSTPTSVYLYSDRAGRLIYIGITSKGPGRQSQHNADKDWWPYVASQKVEHYNDRETAMEREKQLIQAHRPPFNQQHNRGWEHVKAAYLQVVQAEAILAGVQAGDGFTDMTLTGSCGHCPDCEDGDPGNCKVITGEWRHPSDDPCDVCGSNACTYWYGTVTGRLVGQWERSYELSHVTNFLRFILESAECGDESRTQAGAILNGFRWWRDFLKPSDAALADGEVGEGQALLYQQFYLLAPNDEDASVGVGD